MILSCQKIQIFVDHTVIRHIFSVEDSDKVVIVGINGAGKSTLQNDCRSVIRIWNCRLCQRQTYGYLAHRTARQLQHYL